MRLPLLITLVTTSIALHRICQKPLEILMDMISNPSFEEKELIPERNVVHEEFRRSLDSPNQVNFSKIQSSTFSPAYAHSILGTEKSILTSIESNSSLLERGYYNLSNALLVVAGDTADQGSLEKIINKFELPKGLASSFPKFKLKPKAVDQYSQQAGE